jgi:hypothetical protein
VKSKKVRAILIEKTEIQQQNEIEKRQGACQCIKPIRFGQSIKCNLG